MVTAGPRVSVVLPVYNAAPYLRTCLDALLAQTIKEFEVVCVDDGSTDGSSAILNEYAAKDAHIQVYTEENAGAGPARNMGLAQVRTDYVLLADPDDWMKPNMLETLVDCADQCQADVVACDYLRYDHTGEKCLGVECFGRGLAKLSPAFSAADLPGRNLSAFSPCPWNKLYRTDFVRAERLSFQNVPRCNDVLFVLTSLAVARRIAYCGQPLYCYREGRPGSAQTTSATDPTCVCKAYLALQQALRERKLGDLFGRSVARSAYASIVNTLEKLQRSEDAEAFFNDLRQLYVPQIFAARLNLDDFCGNEIEYQRYESFMDAKNLAAFLLGDVRYLHDAYDALVQAGSVQPRSCGRSAVLRWVRKILKA